MISAQNWPKTAKSSWHCSFKLENLLRWSFLTFTYTAMDTFEARAECQANKLTLTSGRERRVLREPQVLYSKNSALPFPGQVNLLARHSARASKVSMAGPSSIFSKSRWQAFSIQSFVVRCWDEFGLEFNWKGALNPVQQFCGEIGAIISAIMPITVFRNTDLYKFIPL